MYLFIFLFLHSFCAVSQRCEEVQKQVKIKYVAVCLQLYGMSTGTRRIVDSLMWKSDNFSSQGYNHKKNLLL